MSHMQPALTYANKLSEKLSHAEHSSTDCINKQRIHKVVGSSVREQKNSHVSLRRIELRGKQSRPDFLNPVRETWR